MRHCKLEQAARQALEYLDNAAYRSLTDHEQTITALREALAEQAEQRSDSERMEPVAEVVLRNQTVGFGRTEERKDVMFLADVGVGSKLYAKPQQQAEQEPVAWVWTHEHGGERLEWEPSVATSAFTSKPLYAAPVRTKDLTDAELHQIWRDIKSLVGLYSFQEIARAVIAADREKNK